MLKSICGFLRILEASNEAVRNSIDSLYSKPVGSPEQHYDSSKNLHQFEWEKKKLALVLFWVCDTQNANSWIWSEKFSEFKYSYTFKRSQYWENMPWLITLAKGVLNTILLQIVKLVSWIIFLLPDDIVLSIPSQFE